MGSTLPSRTDRPDTPPMEKLLGNLKQYTPTEIMTVATFIQRWQWQISCVQADIRSRSFFPEHVPPSVPRKKLGKARC